MNNRRNTSASGITFFDALLLVNIILKLTGIIDWSWWVVLWPLWFSIIIFIIALVFIISIN